MIRFVILPLCLILTGAALAFANVPSVEAISQHPDLFQWFLAISIIGIGYFLNRTLNSVDKNNQQQWKEINKLNTRVSTLEGSLKYGRRKGDD